MIIKSAKDQSDQTSHMENYISPAAADSGNWIEVSLVKY